MAAYQNNAFDVAGGYNLLPYYLQMMQTMQDQQKLGLDAGQAGGYVPYTLDPERDYYNEIETAVQEFIRLHPDQVRYDSMTGIPGRPETRTMARDQWLDIAKQASGLPQELLGSVYNDRSKIPWGDPARSPAAFNQLLSSKAQTAMPSLAQRSADELRRLTREQATGYVTPDLDRDFVNEINTDYEAMESKQGQPLRVGTTRQAQRDPWVQIAMAKTGMSREAAEKIYDDTVSMPYGSFSPELQNNMIRNAMSSQTGQRTMAREQMEGKFGMDMLDLLSKMQNDPFKRAQVLRGAQEGGLLPYAEAITKNQKLSAFGAAPQQMTPTTIADLLRPSQTTSNIPGQVPATAQPAATMPSQLATLPTSTPGVTPPPATTPGAGGGDTSGGIGPGYPRTPIGGDTSGGIGPGYPRAGVATPAATQYQQNQAGPGGELQTQPGAGGSPLLGQTMRMMQAQQPGGEIARTQGGWSAGNQPRQEGDMVVPIPTPGQPRQQQPNQPSWYQGGAQTSAAVTQNMTNFEKDLWGKQLESGGYSADDWWTAHQRAAPKGQAQTYTRWR